MYRYSETRKHILTPELVIHDMKEDGRFGKTVAPFMIVIPLSVRCSLPAFSPL